METLKKYTDIKMIGKPTERATWSRFCFVVKAMKEKRFFS